MQNEAAWPFLNLLRILPVSEWAAWGMVAYWAIILFSNSLRYAYQIHHKSGRGGSREEIPLYGLADLHSAA